MKTNKSVVLCWSAVAVACGTSGSPGTQSGSGSSTGVGSVSGSNGSGTPNSGSSGSPASGSNGGSGTSTGAPQSGTTSGGSGNASGGGAGTGTSSGGGTAGSASGAGGASGSGSGTASGVATGGSSSGSVTVDAGLPDGSVNMVPAGYTGTPFTTITIPGFVYAADYDKGGPGVAYCHSATATGAAACANGIKLSDWCCSACNAAGNAARCDAHNAGACTGGLTTCPLFRPDNDNAGLSHMNLGEVDTYALAGPTWQFLAGSNGPTLDGPTVTVGTPVPQHANMSTEEDTYISYMNTGQWSKYTVEVLAAGKYSVGGFFGVPAGTQITLDFGGGISTGTITLMGSPVTAACMCIEAYHAWTPFANIGQVTFPAPGVYVMTFTLTVLQFNPLYFTFTKM